VRTRTRSWIPAALSVVGLILGEVKPALAEIHLTAAIDAIREYRCGAEYWTNPRPSPRPSALQVAIRSEGEIAYALVEGLDGRDLVTFYTITSKGTKAIVTSSWGYDKTLAKESAPFQESWGRVFDDGSKHALGGEFRLGQLHVPIKCALVLEADTAVKRAMLDAVQRSIAISLTLFNRTGANYPAHVRIVIANFNTDFTATYVLVRETGEIFGVGLNDPVEFPPAEAKYVVWQPYNSSDLPPLRRKIMTTGIDREIQIRK
jgi:hypothetical protein